MLTPKKNSYKEFDSKKKFENSKIPLLPPPPPHNFPNGPSFRRVRSICLLGVQAGNSWGGRLDGSCDR